MAPMSRLARKERDRCLEIVQVKRMNLTHTLLNDTLTPKQKGYLRRVIRLLRELEYAIMEFKSGQDPIVPNGDFTVEEMDRAQAILDELQNPFEENA
jgi:superfamily II RNA helicase